MAFEAPKSSKRQKTNGEHSFFEPDRFKHARCQTFSHWCCPTSFCDRLSEAGFFSCNQNDRVICFYCDLICHQWKIEFDDPCEAHQLLSPKCLFVKAMSSSKSFKLPSHNDYMDPQKRLESFSSWSKNNKFPPTDKLADAGFFCNGTQITCFYCNGSFASWHSNNPPLAEHVRWFPYCSYARQLCGEELYQKIQLAAQDEPGNKQTDKLKKNHQPKVFDDETFDKVVADDLDFLISKKAVNLSRFSRDIVKRCLEDQFRIKGADFANNDDLYFACTILKKQTDLIDAQGNNIIIPSVVLKDIYGKREVVLLNTPKQSYADVLKTFDDDLRRYQNIRTEIGIHFQEKISTTIEREQSWNNCSWEKPLQYGLSKAGFILADPKEYITKCPHCWIEYYNWTSNDNPLLVHKHLSPLCLFVLSQNPFSLNPIPIQKTEEKYTDEIIERAEFEPYDGLVKSKYSRFAELIERRASFQHCPNICPNDVDNLVLLGFYYTNRKIVCFYCQSGLSVKQLNTPMYKCFINISHRLRCRYSQQMVDTDRRLSIHQSNTVITSDKCSSCMIEDKQLAVLPCRHFCLCVSCAKIKRLCPRCNQNVTTYIKVYRP